MLDLLQPSFLLGVQILHQGVLVLFALLSGLLDILKNQLSAFFFFNNALLDVLLIFSVSSTLLLKNLLETEVLFGQLDGTKLGLLHLDLLLFFMPPCFK